MNEALIKDFKQKLKIGAVFGPFMKSGDPAFVEAAGYAKMDFAILDMEHGPVGLERMQNNVRAAQLAGMLPVVRVSELSEIAISQALDIGAAGVQIPQVSTADEASAAVRAAKYAPLGERGVCRFVRAAHYSAYDRKEYFAHANASTLVIIQLEGQQAFENLDEILSVPGIDIIFIGPYDLSQSLGIPGKTTHPKVIEQMREIVLRTKERGIATGTFTDTPETMKIWLDARVQYISYSVDIGIFYEACTKLVKDFQESIQA